MPEIISNLQTLPNGFALTGWIDIEKTFTCGNTTYFLEKKLPYQIIWLQVCPPTVNPPSDGACACCVTAFQNYLKRLIAAIGQSVVPVNIQTTAQTGSLNNVTLLTAENEVVTVLQRDGSETTIPICQLVSVGASKDIVFTEVAPEPISDETGACACCEKPIRMLLSPPPSTPFDLVTTGSGTTATISRATLVELIPNPGLGVIVVCDNNGNYYAVSLCQIAQVVF